MLSQLNIKSTGKQTGNKVAMLASAIALVAVVFATPLNSVDASTNGVQCPEGSPFLDIPSKAELGEKYTHSGVSGLYRVEVVGSKAWGNHPDSSKARYHGSSFFVVKNDPVKFGPDTSPVTGYLGGQRVANGVLHFSSLTLDPPYNQSRKRVAAAALGLDHTIQLNTGDILRFVMDGVRGINPHQQGSFFLNQGDIRVRICLVEQTTTPTATPTTTPIPPDKDKDKDDDADINVVKNPDRSVTRPGHEFTYNITIENTGNVDLDDVKATDTMPGVLQIVSVSDSGDKDGQTVTWKNLSIDAGDKKTVHVTVRVKSNTSNQTISNTVKVKSDDFDVEDSDTDTDIRIHRPAVAAVIEVVPIKTVPITAKTGMSLPLMSLMTLIGAGATAFTAKRYLA